MPKHTVAGSYGKCLSSFIKKKKTARLFSRVLYLFHNFRERILTGRGKAYQVEGKSLQRSGVGKYFASLWNSGASCVAVI